MLMEYMRSIAFMHNIQGFAHHLREFGQANDFL